MPPAQRNVRPKEPIEKRRARGEMSCAECRRHKLKCNKEVPCSSCVRKGCQSICPNGELLPTHGARLGAAYTAAGEKISELSNRIRQLEDALQFSHSSVSTMPHPLLAEDLLLIKNRAVAPSSSSSDPIDSDLVDSLASLTVTDRGRESYVGGSNHDLLNGLLDQPRESANSEGTPIPGKGKSASFSAHPPFRSSLALPIPISHLSEAFPFTPLYISTYEIQLYIEEKLPTYARASSLIEAYFENLSWFFRPVEREQVMGELIPTVYKKNLHASSPDESIASQSGTPDPQAPNPHILALLFAIFAAGASVDMTLPPWNDEAELYYHLARAALSLKPILDGAGIHAVQVVSLIGVFELFQCRTREKEGSWKTIMLSLSIASSIGLNRDPTHFYLSPTLSQRRRRLFWELHALDVWKSLSTGQPMTFPPSTIDCEFPEDTDADLSRGQGRLDSVPRVRYRFVKESMSEIASTLLTTRAMKYSELLRLDQRIRDYDLQGTTVSATPDHKPEHCTKSFHNLMQRHRLSTMKDITLLLLHRNFFARALVEDPINPVRTKFGPSFLSVYRSATSMVSTVHKHIEESGGDYLIRCWPVWVHLLHATTVLGTIATCGSASALAHHAFIQFSNAFEIFPSLQIHPMVNTAVPYLRRLQEQAIQALAEHGKDLSSNPSPTVTPSPESVNRGLGCHTPTSRGWMLRNGFDKEPGVVPRLPKDTLRQQNPVDQNSCAVMHGNLDHRFNDAPSSRQIDSLDMAYGAIFDQPNSHYMAGSSFVANTIQQHPSPDAYPSTSNRDLSPGTFLGSDFDVNFDMHSSMDMDQYPQGWQDNIPPLSLQGVMAQSTLFPNSQYFDAMGEFPESGRWS